VKTTTKKTPSKKPKENKIYIGSKQLDSYVLTAIMALKEHDAIYILARGRRISMAADVALIVANRLNDEGVAIDQTDLATEVIEGRRISTIGILLKNVNK
jgi:DNA-binding protein Alba